VSRINRELLLRGLLGPSSSALDLHLDRYAGTLGFWIVRHLLHPFNHGLLSFNMHRAARVSGNLRATLLRLRDAPWADYYLQGLRDHREHGGIFPMTSPSTVNSELPG